MTSMLLIEAVIVGKPVVSVQIGLKKKNPFVLDRNGILRSILDKETMVNELKKIIIANVVPKYNFNVISDPVKNIIDYVENYLCQS